MDVKFTLKEPVIETLPLISSIVFSGPSFPIPTLDCDTYKALCPYWPILTVLSENASIIGRPAAVFTENNDPDKESSIANNLPEVPSTVNTPDPEALIATDPVVLIPPWSTIRPFLTLNSFGMLYTVFTFQQSVINITDYGIGFGSVHSGVAKIDNISS